MNDFILEWSPDEKIISFGSIGIHWYSLMFLLAFFIGFQIMKKIYIKEKKDIALLDPFLVHMVLGTIIGARLGEVFFYNWDYFQNNLLEIFLPFKIDDSEGVVLFPSALGITTGSFPSMTETHELVVPKSIPIILLIINIFIIRVQ